MSVRRKESFAKQRGEAGDKINEASSIM